MSGDSLPMTSYRPYLLRALTEWINDNGMTPHILVDAGVSGVQVPPGVVHDGRVVLNIADRAVVGLHMDNEWVGFTARFGGVSQLVNVPVGAVLAVYARETGQGMVLPEENMPPTDGGDGGGPSPPSPDNSPGDAPAPGGKRPHLRVVK
ncbi:ClpXP protease specificity-enhancing factor [Pseudoxanthomonas koreensis]|uniref:ClpXP protease specificity-enhancing factor n=1 Tax=Pseudoxanthomonas koreensis TaxID=266061 RepID=UPI0035A5AAF8